MNDTVTVRPELFGNAVMELTFENGDKIAISVNRAEKLANKIQTAVSEFYAKEYIRKSKR